MRLLANWVRTFVTTMVERETDPINQARVRMLFYVMISYLGFALSLIVAYAYTNQHLQLTRACAILFFAVLLIGVMYRANAWRLVSHIVILLLTFMGVWSNLLIYVHGVNAATLQYIWLACALAFYMHGAKWGWIYSLMNIAPVLVDTLVNEHNSFFLTNTPQAIEKPVYFFVLVFDFSLIIFLHYFFFKTYSENFKTLMQTQDELNASNELLNNTLEDVKRLSNARMDFLSTMSHELRTPLNGVIGLTNVLLKQNPREDQEETLSVLNFSAENLLMLVNDILDLNKLDSGKVELEHTPFSLLDLVNNIYASLKIKAAEKDLDFELQVSESLRNKLIAGDPTRLTQVFLNLINNAIKFTDSGFVRLSCEDMEHTEDIVKIRFAVEDSGIGIDQARHQNIFETFIQESVSTNRTYGGTGLGLSIVKKVLDLYQSEIKLESESGKGAKFTFDIVFPYHIIEDTASDKKVIYSGKIHDLSHLKVLVAEDNLVNVLVLKKTLIQQDIKPDIAENGKQALQLIQEKDYDVVLMDLHMPEMDGNEAAKHIRNLKDKEKANIPIIALTATVNDTVINEVFAAGMNDYLSKPFRSEDLFEKLERLNIRDLS